MDSAELRRVLRNAGLSKYQSQAYTALLQHGTASATELADASGVPPARIYDVLRDLEDHGYVETYEGDTLRARAADPDGVLADLRDRSERLTEAAAEIEERWEAPELDQHRVDIVKRYETVFDRARDAIAGAQTEVQVSTTLDGFESLRDALASAHDNGAAVKVTLHSLDDEEDVPNDLDGVVTEVRRRDLPSPFVVIVDRTTTCFAPHRRSVNEYGVLVEDPTLTYVFRWYFDTSLWEVWEVVYDGRPENPPQPYANIRRFIREVDPLVRAGATVHVEINGAETGTGDPVTVSGTVDDVVYAGEPAEDGNVPIGQLAGQVTVVVMDGDERHTVGGWGAVIEDLEATKLVITDVEWPETVEHAQ